MRDPVRSDSSYTVAIYYIKAPSIESGCLSARVELAGARTNVALYDLRVAETDLRFAVGRRS